MMLVSPKWKTMWMESQHFSKASNVPASSKQSKYLLEDLRSSCFSPNKSVQLEALTCLEAWINNQNQDDWKLCTVCYAAVSPLLISKMHPFHKDVDLTKLRFNLMWALLRKVENIINLEGPQYILEVFLHSCLNWLSICAEDGEEEEISELIFQLLTALFSKENVNTRDKEMFQSLSADIFKVSRVFHRLADKILKIFVFWKKVQNKNLVLKLWKHFLERCEVSREHLEVFLWHKIFKLVGEICSEKSEPVKRRLGMLYGCVTTLRSELSSSKFLGNLLLTPCEALFKKLADLCCLECEEFYDAEMFVQVMETSKVLSVESVAISGYGLVINLLNRLDEFSLKSLYWGVWCGLVHCFNSLHSDVDETHLSKVQMNFYRKLRGIAINFELDKNYLGEECIVEVERHFRFLNVCLCSCRSSRGERRDECEKDLGTEITMGVPDRSSESLRVVDPNTKEVFGQLVPKTISVVVASGKFSVRKKAKQPQPRIISINIDLVRHILKTLNVSCVKSFLNDTFHFRFISSRVCDPNSESKNFSLRTKLPQKKLVKTLRGNVFENVQNKAITYPEEKWVANDEVKSVPLTRSRKRAEEEEKRKEIENQKRKTRKSFEIRVQEIVQKNKERKTEKNCGKPRVILMREKRKKHEREKAETLEPKQNKKEKSPKLENYFKVISKKSGSNDKKKKTTKGREKMKKEEEERKEEVCWKQTSLVTMMAQGKETPGEEVRTRSKEKKVSNGKMKTKVMEDSPLAKLSPFKEVFHDHEYARMEPRDLKAIERIIVNKEELEEKTANVERMNEVPEKEKETNGEVKTKRAKAKEGKRKSRRLSTEAFTVPEPEIETCEVKSALENTSSAENVPEKLKKSKCVLFIDLETETRQLTTPESFSKIRDATEVDATESDLKSSTKVENIPESQFKKFSPEAKNVFGVATENRTIKSPLKEAGVGEEVAEIVDEIRQESKFRERSPIKPDEAEVCLELDSTPRRGKKRCRTSESPKPVKKLKLEDPQEKEVEKENLEEVSPTKEEKSLKGSPKTMNGMISSRALRMIALVPESTRSQVHWETSPKVEVKKKGPNVDKNSRASKMLALLSENVVREVVEPEEIKIEEMKSNGDLGSNPLGKTLTSSLKSPKTVKQRRSIRFDDAKNETVIYETDTPPSQVLEGKESWRRIKLLESKSPIHSVP